nr:ATP-binding cassette domain-containing protein [Streptomyces sp. DSM 41633]
MSRLLEVSGLKVDFPTDTDAVHAVRGLDFHVNAGEVVALVGESGAGKSASAMAVVGLRPEFGEVSGSVRLRGEELIGLSDAELSRVRGSTIGTVFQDPMSALTPVYTVGDQIAEALTVHNRDLGRRTART